MGAWSRRQRCRTHSPRAPAGPTFIRPHGALIRSRRRSSCVPKAAEHAGGSADPGERRIKETRHRRRARSPRARAGPGGASLPLQQRERSEPVEGGDPGPFSAVIKASTLERSVAEALHRSAGAGTRCGKRGPGSETRPAGGELDTAPESPGAERRRP
ncbi:hypothetical protein NDU88_006563 [Pleurodeles waltl]|uniref:Uncharacterized protein n=1 Tax=Pleurodeles waltl TaxID=8319 RepID=A0AAV7UN45_PLEWA|nr:hypothetical protein NDU88_006563 [Pleurodeles waltl]